MKNRFFWISWKLCWELLICFCDWLRALNAIWKVPPTIIKFWNQLGIVHKSYDVSLRSLSPEWSNMYGLFITPNILNSDHLVKIIKFFLKSIRKTKSFLPHSFRIILRIIVRFPFPSTIAFWFALGIWRLLWFLYYGLVFFSCSNIAWLTDEYYMIYIFTGRTLSITRYHEDGSSRFQNYFLNRKHEQLQLYQSCSHNKMLALAFHK